MSPKFYAVVKFEEPLTFASNKSLLIFRWYGMALTLTWFSAKLNSGFNWLCRIYFYWFKKKKKTELGEHVWISFGVSDSCRVKSIHTSWNIYIHPHYLVKYCLPSCTSIRGHQFLPLRTTKEIQQRPKISASGVRDFVKIDGIINREKYHQTPAGVLFTCRQGGKANHR